MESIIRFSCDYVNDSGLSPQQLQEEVSKWIAAGKPLPEGVEVISLNHLLAMLNEHDPTEYFKPVLTPITYIIKGVAPGTDLNDWISKHTPNIKETNFLRLGTNRPVQLVTAGNAQASKHAIMLSSELLIEIESQIESLVTNNLKTVAKLKGFDKDKEQFVVEVIHSKSEDRIEASTIEAHSTIKFSFNKNEGVFELDPTSLYSTKVVCYGGVGDDSGVELLPLSQQSDIYEFINLKEFSSEAFSDLNLEDFAYNFLLNLFNEAINQNLDAIGQAAENAIQA